MWRIRSVPGNRVLPVRSSAIIHPTDQISTETQKQKKNKSHATLPWWNIDADIRSELFSATYLSCCSASSSTWSPGRGTNGWPHSQSSRHQCAALNQSPKSESNASVRILNFQNIPINRKSWDKMVFRIRAIVYWPSAHSLHLLPGYWVLDPVEGGGG